MRRRSALVAAALAVVAVALAAIALTRHAAGAREDARVPAAKAIPCATSSHPYPVVLVPGTFEATSWMVIADALVARGYCVKAFHYPAAGTSPIEQSASDLGRFVNRVLSSTRATRVSIVTHSEGGVVARYYVRFLGGARKVQDLVSLAPPNHGTTTPLVIPGELLGCLACAQQTAGSGFLAHLNAGNGLPPPVKYTVIATRYDAVVTPYQSALLRAPANRVTNVVLQDACPDDLAGHLAITSDPVAVQWVEEALARSGPADPAFKPQC